MHTTQQLNELIEQVKSGSISRRSFLAAAAGLGLSVTMARSLFTVYSASAAPAAATTRSLEALQDEPKAGGQVIVGYSQEPTLFNPMLSNLEVDRGVQFSIFDSLWRIDETAAFTPNLATEIPSVENGGISADGLTYTFKIRQDASFHDGTPLTAADVLFTHKTIMDPNVTSPMKLGHDKVVNAELVDDYTVKLTLGESFAPFLVVWSDTYIVPEHILSGVTDMLTTDFNSTAPIGSGPFKFESRTPGEAITVAKNEAYHGPGPYLDKIIFKYVPDLESLFTQFKTGEVEVTGLQGITPDNYEEAQTLTAEGKSVVLSATAFVEFIYFNLGLEMFQDAKVREALYYAMDKKNIIDAVYYGVHSPSETYLAESSWALDPDLPVQEYNPDKAKALLDEAGWVAGSDGIREKNGVKLSFTNSTTAGNAVREQAQQYLQQTWKDVGVDMQIDNMPAAVIWGDYYMKSQYQTVMVGEISGVGGDPDATARFASSQIPAKTNAGKNTMQYANPTMDDLLAQGARETDQAARKTLYFQVQEILRTDLPVLPIFHYNWIEGTKGTLQNYKPNAFV